MSTTAAAQPVAVSSVRFDTSQFEFSHGRKPKGRGTWWFDDGVHLEFVARSGSTFTEARAEAAEHFAAMGSRVVKVMP